MKHILPRSPRPLLTPTVLAWLLLAALTPAAANAVGRGARLRATRPDAASNRLAKGKTVRLEIREGGPQSVSVSLAAGQCAQVIFLWRGLDLSVSVIAPADSAAGWPPVPVRAPGPVSVSLIADVAGEYRLEARPLDGLKVNGWYEVTLAAVRHRTPDDELRRRAERAMAEGSHPSASVSREKIEEARRLWQSVGDLTGQAAALSALADLNRSQDVVTAVKQYEEAAALRRRLNDPVAEAHTLVDLGNAHRRASRREEASASYKAALSLFRGARDRVGESSALYNIGFALAVAGDYREAVTYYEQALAIQSADGDRPREATTLNALGGVYDRLGDYDAALSFYQRAARIRLELDDRLTGALLLNNVSTLNVSLGNWQEAKESYEAALAVYESFVGKGFTACGAAGSERDKTACRYAAYTLDNLGELYITLGDPQAALPRLQQSYSMHAALNDSGGQGLARAHMCYSTLLQGMPREALKLCEEALSLQTPPGEQAAKVDPPRAYTLTVMGMVYDALGGAAQARGHYERAAEFHSSRGDRRAAAITLDKAGAALARGGDARAAFEKFDAALSLWREIKDEDGEALTLYQMARAERGRGNLAEAHARINRAIDIVESLRGKVSAQRLRASYFAQKVDYYELAVDLKMQLAKAGGSGVAAPEMLVASALQTTERARARVLFDILAEARVEPRAGSHPKLDALLRRRRELQRKLNNRATLQVRLLAEKTPAAQLASVKDELEELAAEYDDVDAEARKLSPRYSELTRPQPLDVTGIQRELLDEQTLLLEYALGEERSYLWVVSKSGVKSFELRKRADIEEAARRAVETFGDRRQMRSGETAQAHQERVVVLEDRFREEAALLSEMLLRPASELLGRRRLLVVADGLLQQVPFAALPSPAPAGDGSGQPSTLKVSSMGAENGPPPLGERHEIVNLPSASTLGALRVEMKRRTPPPRAVAVLADPIFDRDDPRLEEALKARPGQIVSQQRPHAQDDAVRSFGASLPRLLASRKEARGIVAAAPAGMATASLDFKANRSAVTDPRLGQHRIVHFATHGVFNDKQPELSGIILSLFDESGRQREDGFLRLHDIYSLNLPVEMVVLSACQTGRGKQVRGEGLIGLTRGFMYAGAPRVVASLWKVDDEATAELMKLFYQHMLKGGLPPPAALREAQMSVRAQRRWRAPYYWAGFVLHGEWR